MSRRRSAARVSFSTSRVRHQSPRKPVHGRSTDLAGPLPANVVQFMVAVFASIANRRVPWPDTDPDAREAGWDDVLSDPRARRSRAKYRQPKDRDAGLRLDRWPASTITFTCDMCGLEETAKTTELRHRYSGDRNVLTIGPT